MSKLSIDNAKEILEANIQKIYHLPNKYEYLHHYIDKGCIRETLLKVLNFVKKQENIILYKHKYCFCLSNEILTYQVRRKTMGLTVSNHHINLLCAIGLINKQYQTKDDDRYLTEINKDFLQKTGKKRPINTFYFRRFTDEELERLEL